jgi:hypothetical protein
MFYLTNFYYNRNVYKIRGFSLFNQGFQHLASINKRALFIFITQAV